MKKESVIITGSEGIVGSEVSKHFGKTRSIQKLSLRFGDDLTNEDFVKDYFSKNEAEYLVNCFGLNDHYRDTAQPQTLYEVSLESINEYLSVNVTALFSVCREFAKNEKAKGIVNFSSVYGLVSPRPSMYESTEKHIGYSVSKGAVVQLTRHLAAHLAPKVRVNCVVLGGIEEPSLPPEFVAAYSKNVPMKRMMRRNECIGIVEYLCSEKSTYTTGSILTVTGGWLLW